MLVISRFGFGGWVWVVIASVPDLCIRFTFKHLKISFQRGENKPSTSVMQFKYNKKYVHFSKLIHKCQTMITIFENSIKRRIVTNQRYLCDFVHLKVVKHIGQEMSMTPSRQLELGCLKQLNC